jgi:5-methylcytosine-specific restriction endonuclease McrA
VLFGRDMLELAKLSDKELLTSLSAICVEGYARTARMLLFLIEVEQRRLHLKAAYGSMAEFCIRELKMSEGTASRRVNAALLLKRFPSLLPRIERGDLHLSTLGQLRDHLTEENVDELTAAVAGKTWIQVEELLARRSPKPDVPSSMLELRKGDSRRRPAKIQPLSESRYLLQLTMSKQLRDKLERARDMMSHRNPSNELEVIIEAAIDALVPKLESQRFGKAKESGRATRTAKPDSEHTSAAKSRRRRPKVSVAVRRAVFERDGEACTFVGRNGKRCGSRRQLELDHHEPHARGGASNVANLRVRCRAHNRLHAEEVFGKEHVAHAIETSREKKKTDRATNGASQERGPRRRAAS